MKMNLKSSLLLAGLFLSFENAFATDRLDLFNQTYHSVFSGGNIYYQTPSEEVIKSAFIRMGATENFCNEIDPVLFNNTISSKGIWFAIQWALTDAYGPFPILTWRIEADQNRLTNVLLNVPAYYSAVISRSIKEN